MKTVLFSGIAAAGLMFTATGAGASDSLSLNSEARAQKSTEWVANGRAGGGKPDFKPGMGMTKPGMRHGDYRPGFHGIPRTDVYRRPHRGFVLPRYWVQPTFYVTNFRNLGLSAPPSGHYWSRYYDDAVLTDSRGYVQDYRSGVDWDADYEAPDRYSKPEYRPAMRADSQAYEWGDENNVAFAAPDGSSYSYDGEWDGRFVDPEGRVFEGDWSGTVTRRAGVASPGFPAPVTRSAGAPYPEPDYSYENDDYNIPRGYENYERCLKSNGLKGAAIGAVLGGFAGNRIAGRGDRLGGTLVGAGIGGLLGMAIEKANEKCKQHRPGYSDYRQSYQQHSYGRQSGYYYYPQSAPVVTTITVAPVITTTTTVTEEVYYETARAAPRKKHVRKWKPKPKARCICR